MKTFVLLLFLPFTMLAQEVSCSKSSILYSRELFPGSVTIERAVALSGFDDQCAQNQNENQSFSSNIKVSRRQIYQYYPIDHVAQDINGRDIFLGIVTDQLVNHLVFDRN